MPVPISVRMLHVRVYFLEPDAHTYFQMLLSFFVLMPVPHVRAYFIMPIPVSVRMPNARAYFLMPLAVARRWLSNAIGIPFKNAAIHFRLRTKGVLPAPASQSFIY